MSSLDDRQIDILKKMGVDIWRLREQQSEILDQAAALEVSVAKAEVREEVPLPPGANDDSSIDTLEHIATQVSQCRQCELSSTRIKAVPGIGNEKADWMFIGEAPGKNEDEKGLPFVGRAGQLLDAMIAALNMNRRDVFIANVIKCRPPGNRDPRTEEITECIPYLHRQLAIIKPKIIVALGRISAQALLNSTAPLGQLRGKVHQFGEDNIPLIATYHPAYLLRSPEQKSKSWEDLLFASSLVHPEKID